MANDDSGDKTEQPTDRRREDSRRKGNVARSVDLSAAGLLLAAAAAMAFFGGLCTRTLGELLSASLRAPAWLQPDTGLMLRQFQETLDVLARGVLPFLLFMGAAALVLNLGQVGFLWAPEVLQPKFTRLNPLEGLKRIFSLQALVKLGASLGKLLLVTVIAAWYIAVHLHEFMQMFHLETPAILAGIGSSLVELAFLLASSLFALAVIDYGFQRWKFEQELRMTKQEIREEMKEMEGDPRIRQRRREIHRKLATSRELSRVKEADVIITNPTHIAVALKYDAEKMAAPTVLAKGMGEIALRIRQIAVENGIPIIERKPLARALYQSVKIGRAIPVEMYEVFVEIMAYVYRLKGRKPPGPG